MFTEIIEYLIALGLTEKQIGEKVGASQATINRIKSGNQKPYYELGEALIQFHKEKLLEQEAAA